MSASALDSQRVLGLLQQLVLHILRGEGSQSRQENASDRAIPDADLSRHLSYAIRILGSRMAPSLAPDEAGVAEAIKKRMVQAGRPSDALMFADLHRRLSSQSGPGRLQHRWALLHLLRAISEDARREGGTTTAAAVPFGSRLSNFVQNEGLTRLDLGAYSNKQNGVGAFANGKASNGSLYMNGLYSADGELALENSAANRSGSRASEKAQSKSEPVSEDPRAQAYAEFVSILQEEGVVPENELVRDVVFACQAIDGKHVSFDPKEDAYVVNPSLQLPDATRMLLHKLCELGWMYRKVKSYMTQSLSGGLQAIGTVGQAFCSSLQQELQDYYRLMAVLESQVHQPVPLPGGQAADKERPYLSLRRLAVWLAEPLLKMRLMAELVDNCRTSKGGAMASLVHLHSQHGDPFVTKFMSHLLQKVCAPIFEMIRHWVLEGELEDLYREFFIVADRTVRDEGLWRDCYRVDKAMLPSFVPDALAHTILRAGKSINFLRLCCQDQGWSEAVTEFTSPSTPSLGYGEGAALEAMVSSADLRISARLLHIMFQSYKLQEHCLAIKRYLLLGQGDFIQYLMDAIAPELNQLAKQVSAFKLAGVLEAAIRASSAEYDDSEVLDKLRVKLLPYNDLERGWDVFSLEYVCGMPLSTVFTEAVMARYLRIFNFLWRLKRVHHALNATWQTMKPTARVASAYKGRTSAEKKLWSEMQRCHTLRSQINHFITNLQYYMMFEVLECSWVDFVSEMTSAADLDALIAAHEKYLDTIVQKGLLGEHSQLLCRTLFSLFEAVMRFKGFADKLYEAARGVQAAKDQRDKMPASQRRDGEEGAEATLPDEVLEAWSREMDEIAKSYSTLLEAFLNQLPQQEHVDLRFLSFRLDFSEYYTRKLSGPSTPSLKLR